VIIPGIVASAHGNTGSGGTGSPSNLPTSSDYIGVQFTNSPTTTVYSIYTPITFSWVPTNVTTVPVTGYIAVITYTDAYGDVVNQTFNTTGTSVTYAPAVGSSNGTYTCTVTAVTATGATGQATSTTLTAYVANGSAESSGTSGNSSVAYTVVSNGIVSTLPAGEVIFGEIGTSGGGFSSAP
jgi:hypothetical protein